MGVARGVREYGWRVELWWQVEQFAGWAWHRVCRDGVSCWLDWLPSWALRHRYAAERRRNPQLFR